MNKFRYNDKIERCKRVNRLFLLAVALLFFVLVIYQLMMVADGISTIQRAIFSIGIILLFFIVDSVVFFKNRDTKCLKYFITIEVGIVFLFFMLTTPANFLGLALVGGLGVSILYYDSKISTYTFIAYLILYLGGQLSRIALKVVEGDSNGICQVIMTLAVFVMLFVIGRLSKLFSDHALGTVAEQNAVQEQIMNVVQKESNTGTDMVNSLYDASLNIAESMQDISVSTEKIVENITEQTYMTQDIQKAISNTLEYSAEMVSIATISNEEIQVNQGMMERLQEQSVQIARTNQIVTEAMERLQQRTKEVATIATMILKISKETNILALNASIESARAGEAGLGFAVVAGQIRELAAETRNSTERIAGIVEELDSNAEEAVEVIRESVTAAESQNETISTTAEAFEELSKNMTMLIDNIQEINTKIDNLSDANNQIVDNITQLSALSEEVSSSAEETNNLTGHNLEYAQQTKESIQLIRESTKIISM